MKLMDKVNQLVMLDGKACIRDVKHCFMARGLMHGRIKEGKNVIHVSCQNDTLLWRPVTKPAQSKTA